MMDETNRFQLLTRDQARAIGQAVYYRAKPCNKCESRWFYTIADRCFTCQRRANGRNRYDSPTARGRRAAEALRDRLEVERLESGIFT